MQEADAAFKTWKKVKPEVRADVLFRAAAIIRRRKHEFSALLTKEAGKPWNEADADTAEAIDFLEYYGRQMLRLKASSTTFQDRGSEVGDYLVDHPNTRFISFTGSKEVGLRIAERSSKVNEGQIWMKRLIAEMGGRNTMVVDNNADLELAAQSIVKSAF